MCNMLKLKKSIPIPPFPQVSFLKFATLPRDRKWHISKLATLPRAPYQPHATATPSGGDGSASRVPRVILGEPAQIVKMTVWGVVTKSACLNSQVKMTKMAWWPVAIFARWQLGGEWQGWDQTNRHWPCITTSLAGHGGTPRSLT